MYPVRPLVFFNIAHKAERSVWCSWTPGAGGAKKSGFRIKLRQASQDLLFIFLFALLLTGQLLCCFQHLPGNSMRMQQQQHMCLDQS